VTLTAPEFSPPAQTKQLIVPADSDSEIVSFFHTPLRTGKLKILVELQWEETVRGTRRLVTECVAEGATIPAEAVLNVVRMPLGVEMRQAFRRSEAIRVAVFSRSFPPALCPTFPILHFWASSKR
jgi:hypothetical protein